MDQDQVFLAFSRKRERKIIVTVLAVGLCFFVGPLLSTIIGGTWVIAIGVLGLLCLGVFVWQDWRCPVCEGTLGRELNYAFCPKCGSQLSP